MTVKLHGCFQWVWPSRCQHWRTCVVIHSAPPTITWATNMVSEIFARCTGGVDEPGAIRGDGTQQQPSNKEAGEDGWLPGLLVAGMLLNLLKPPWDFCGARTSNDAFCPTRFILRSTNVNPTLNLSLLSLSFSGLPRLGNPRQLRQYLWRFGGSGHNACVI